MSASQNDKFMHVGAGTTTTMSAPGKALAATAINVGSTANMPTDTRVIIAIRTVDANGELVAGTYTEWSADPGVINFTSKQVKVMLLEIDETLNQLAWQITTDTVDCDYYLSSVFTDGVEVSRSYFGD